MQFDMCVDTCCDVLINTNDRQLFEDRCFSTDDDISAIFAQSALTQSGRLCCCTATHSRKTWSLATDAAHMQRLAQACTCILKSIVHTVTLVPVPKVNAEGDAELAGVYCVDTRFIGLCCLEVAQVPPQSRPSSKYDRSWALWTSKTPDKVRSSNRYMFRKVGSSWPGLAWPGWYLV